MKLCTRIINKLIYKIEIIEEQSEKKDTFLCDKCQKSFDNKKSISGNNVLKHGKKEKRIKVRKLNSIFLK